MKFSRNVILICEDGWEGIREFSIFLSQKGIFVSVIIKGDPGIEVREMITPRPGIQNYFLKRDSYRIVLFPLLLWFYLWNRWDVCCVTKMRTYENLKKIKYLIPFGLYLFEDGGKDSSLISVEGKKMTMDALLLKD